MNTKSSIELSASETRYINTLGSPAYDWFRHGKVDEPAPGKFPWFLREKQFFRGKMATSLPFSGSEDQQAKGNGFSQVSPGSPGAPAGGADGNALK